MLNRMTLLLLSAMTSVAFCAAASFAEPPTVVSKQHIIAFTESGRFCGWPANNGTYMWGDEVVVGFEFGYYQEGGFHHRDESRPTCRAQLRSTDGGLTWAPDPGGPCVPGNFSDDPKLPPPQINYGHPDFGYTSHGSDFHITYNRAATWLPSDGSAYAMAYPPPFFTNTILTCRPSFLVNGPQDCMFICSATEEGTSSQDRTYLARTTDGQNINFVSWIGPSDGSRSVMGVAARISGTKVVCALRRKNPGDWIDLYVSDNDGASWGFLSRIATFSGENGNPPSLVRMRDGRLVCAYGRRDNPKGICAKVSEDDGATWSDEIVLRDDALDQDIGYCTMVQRPDGKLLTAYYFRTAANPENFIGVTIWELEAIAFGPDLNQDGVTNFLDYSHLVQDGDIMP
jgi:hypothetical protein